MKKLYAFAVVIALVTGLVAAHFYRTFDPSITLYKWPYKKQVAFTITCDDISPGYPLDYFQEIQSVLEEYGLRATFFVIPYHGEWDLLTESPLVIGALHQAEQRGHEIALHGYAHYEDEFVCSPQKQRELLEKALTIMKEAGFEVKGFRAPCLKTTSETLDIVREYDFVYDSSVFNESGISWEDTFPQVYSGHEYTWYLAKEDLSRNLDAALQDFETAYKKGDIFSLVIHMKAVNEGEGITLLKTFFSLTETKVWNFTLIELVEWELQHRAVHWESKKTIAGGELTVENVPPGLVMNICLPSYYTLKEVPEGIDIDVLTQGETSIFEVTFNQYFKKSVLYFGLTYKSSSQTSSVLYPSLVM